MAPPVMDQPGVPEGGPSLPAARLLRSLRAVRRFSPQPISDAVLLEILNVARWTGSARNRQPWHLIVVRDRARLQRLSAFGRYAEHVPGAQAAIVLVIDGPETDVDHAFDAGRLAQNIMLAAWAYGLGSCIASLSPADNQKRAKVFLGVPGDRSVRTVISLGYPADSDARFLSHTSGGSRPGLPLGRKPLTEIVSWERYGRGQPE